MSHHDEESLAVFMHGALMGLHVFCAVYAAKKRTWRDVIAHGIAATYDLWAFQRHLSASKHG